MTFHNQENDISMGIMKAINHCNIDELDKITKQFYFDPNTSEFIINGMRYLCLYEFGDTALHYAARRNNAAVIEILLKNCFKMIEVKNEDFESPAVVALKMDHFKSFKLLCFPSIASERNRDGENLLHIAAKFNNINALKFLIGKVDINSKTYNGCSSLIIAAENGNTEIVKILIDNKAKLSETDKYGNNALHISLQNDHIDVCQLVIKRGIDVNCSNDIGEKPLIMAVSKRYVDIVKLLLKYGARKDIRNENNLTPYEMAKQYYENTDDSSYFLIYKILKDSKTMKFFNYLATKFIGKEETLPQPIQRCKTTF